jgi:zinc D-Ala-D-Ala carboxypeptidase
MKLSKFVNLSDAIKSQTAIRKGIDNSPTEAHLENIKRTSELFDKIKEKFPKAVISSFYRSDKLNKAIGGSKTSQHSTGEAIDIDSQDNLFNAEIFNFIKLNLPFDQLIWEFGNSQNPDWVHVSVKAEKNRNQVLKAIRINGKVKYEKYRCYNCSKACTIAK